MIQYICCPNKLTPKRASTDVEYISLYKTKALAEIEAGDAAISLKHQVAASGILPSVEAWDFCSIAMAVAAIDESALRKSSADGWTRVLRAQIHVVEPLIWQNQIHQLEDTLRFLTGDFWKISILPGGEPRPEPREIKKYEANCVSLLSGGIDSLVGAIDLHNAGEKPVFVSKIVSGDMAFQTKAAAALGASQNHVQWSFTSRSASGYREGTTRARSIIFFAYAALVASSIARDAGKKTRIPIYVPENGFISLNLPLTPLRMGTLSTKTTHPTYLQGLQKIWNSVGMRFELTSPFNYRFRTKGEMISECGDKALLKTLIGDSTSCGRYGRYNHTHCGRCIPCLVRRAAFLKAGIRDSTAFSSYKDKKCRYVFSDLKLASEQKKSSDIRAAAHACLQLENEGIESFVSSGLSFAPPQDRPLYIGVVQRGLDEIRTLLQAQKIL